MTKRLLTDFFSSVVTSTAKECSDTQDAKTWLRSHFPYRDSKPDANNIAFFDLIDALNERQLLALLYLRNGFNIFVTGCAGTGKTLWLRAAIAVAQAMGKSVAVCATTSQAASNINVLDVEELPPLEFPDQSEIVSKEPNSKKKKSTKVNNVPKKKTFKKRKIFEVTPRTLHSWAGIGYEDFDPLELATKFLSDSRFVYVKNRWIYTNVLFMDEVSMLAPKLFVKLDQLGQFMRKSSKPFGGIQIVVVADFFQLPPVIKNQISYNNESLQIEQEERERLAFEQALESEEEDDQKDQDDDEDQEDEAFAQFQKNRITMQPTDTTASTVNILDPILNPENARCCFQTKTWHETIQHNVVFNEIFRQKNPAFIDLLCELRRGIVSPENIERLEKRTRYKLTNDLSNIAHQVFGGRNCERLKMMITKVFNLAREKQRFLSQSNQPVSLLQLAEIDTTVNMSINAPFETVVPNWHRFEQHLLRTSIEQEFDSESALLYLLPDEFVPASHEILVSEIEPTHIMSLVAQVDACNALKLSVIKSPTVTFSAGVKISITVANPHYASAQEHFAKEFSKNTTPLVLKLKIGAQVLLTSNIAPRFYNGRRGVVVGFMKRTDFATQYPQTGVLLAKHPAEDDDENYPVVLFDNGIVARVGRHSWERKRSFAVGAKPVVAELEQFPLTLAFAITIHKSQGMTINRLSVNLTRAFECGIPYVALSRGINLESIVIEQMDRSIFDGSQPKLLPPPVVVAFYDKLERESDERKISQS